MFKGQYHTIFTAPYSLNYMEYIIPTSLLAILMNTINNHASDKKYVKQMQSIRKE